MNRETSMNSILYPLIHGNYLDLNTIKSLALTCRETRKTIGFFPTEFSWFTRRTSTPNLETWYRKLKETHSIIVSATLMLECVQEGERTLSYCTYPERWLGEAKNNHFDLEQMLKNHHIKNRVSACNHHWEYHDLTVDRKEKQFQHYHVSQRWRVNTRVIRTDWSWNEDGYHGRQWLCQSKPVEKCECYHCKTVGTYPSSECMCSKCSDQVSGRLYWGKLTEPF